MLRFKKNKKKKKAGYSVFDVVVEEGPMVLQPDQSAVLRIASLNAEFHLLVAPLANLRTFRHDRWQI
jgi:hypothetical protein